MRNWWRHRTLRFRLAVWYAIGGSVLLTCFSATIYFYVARRMALPLAHPLQQDLAIVQQRLRIEPDGRVLWDGRPPPKHTEWPAKNPWFEIWDDKGRLVHRLWPLDDTKYEQLNFPPSRRRDAVTVFRIAPDMRLRVLPVPYRISPDGPEWMLRIMRAHQPVADALGALLLIIVVATPAVILLLVFGGYLATHHWLKPLDDLAREADHIRAEDLSRRLPVANPHDELGRLATVFNHTLARLEDSFTTLDQFVANASHELRTPLTTLRSVGEVGLARSRTEAEYREIIGSMLEDALRLESLVDRLLHLARTEGGREASNPQPVNLEEIVEEVTDELQILAEEKRQRLVFARASELSLEITTDALLLRQALHNVVENATKYSPPEAEICLSLKEADQTVCIEVTDSGPGIALEDRPHLTRRFFRVSSTRGREPGYGLGLALTKAYLRILGGALEYQPAKPHGSTFRLVLPKIAPAIASPVVRQLPEAAAAPAPSPLPAAPQPQPSSGAALAG